MVSAIAGSRPYRAASRACLTVSDRVRTWLDGLSDLARVALIAEMCLGFFVPRDYAIGALLSRVWGIYSLVVSVVAIVFVLCTRRAGRRWMLFGGFFFTYFIVSTMVSPSNALMRQAFVSFVRSVGFISLVEWGLGEGESFFRGFLITGGIMCFLHFLTFIVYRDTLGGMQAGVVETVLGNKVTEQNWHLLTYDNASVYYFLPVCLVGWVYALRHGWRARVAMVAAHLTTLFMYFYLMAVTALIVMLIFSVAVLIAMLAVDTPRERRLPAPSQRAYRIVLICCLAFCVIVTVGLAMGLFGWFAGFLGKGATFSGRFYVWRKAILSALSAPLFGYGFEDVAVTVDRLGYSHAHNMLLQALYTGGIVSLGLYCTALFAKGRQTLAATNPMWLVAITSFVCVFVLGLADWQDGINMPYLVFLLTGNLCLSKAGDAA